jgi:hypothetical protein
MQLPHPQPLPRPAGGLPQNWEGRFCNANSENYDLLKT